MEISGNILSLLADFDRRARDSRYVSRQESLTRQYIGRPAGPKAKGHKTPATGILPYTRFSVVGSTGSTPTAANAARAKDLRRARNRKIRAAKNSAEI